MTNDEKIVELLNSPEFMENLDSLKSMKDLCQAFAENGVEISESDAQLLSNSLVKINSSSELDIEDLDNVSGGAGFGIKKTISVCISAFKTGWKYGGKFCDWVYKTFGVC